MHAPLTAARPRATLIATLALALALAMPAIATATPLAGMTAILLYESPISDTPLLSVTARVADDVTLPAEIVLPVPEGANVMWSGEFFPGEGEENILVPARQEVRDGIPVVVFTLTQSRLGHVQVTYPGSTVTTNALSGIEEIGFDIVLPVETGLVYAAIAVPPTVQVLTGSDVVQMSQEEDGLTYYFTERPSGAPGDPVALSLQVQEIAPPDLYNERVPWMVMLVGAVIVGAAVLLVISRKRRSPGESA